jgi:4-amino-4-deoxy-L-arabinose transferase-like glycosyltransferase
VSAFDPRSAARRATATLGPAGAALAVAVGLALAVRAAVLALAWHAPIDMDGTEYVRIAQSVAAGDGPIGIRGLPILIYQPLYPWAIAAFVHFGADPETAALWIAALCGTAFVALVYAVGATVYGRRTGFYAALVAAVLPICVQTSTTAITEAPFAAAATAGLWGLLRLLRTWSVRDAALCGAGFGVAYLVRPEGALFALAALVIAMLAPGRRALPIVVMGALAALLAVPALANTYAVTGRVALEGKSTINFRLSEGLRHGASYLSVADATDAQGRPVGPEIDTRYLTPSLMPRPSLSSTIASALSAEVKHVRDVAVTFKSRDYGAGLLVVLALAGLCFTPWPRRRVRDELVLGAFLAVGYVALASVFHFWARYGALFLPVAVVWAGHGVTRSNRWRLGLGKLDLIRTGLALALAGFIAVDLAAARAAPSPLEREAGAWLAAKAPQAPLVADVSSMTAFYAGGTWAPLPYAGEPAAARYLERLHPAYVVFDSSRAAEYPPLRGWFEHGLPAALGERVRTIGDGHGRQLVIYRWSASTRTASTR